MNSVQVFSTAMFIIEQDIYEQFRCVQHCYVNIDQDINL